MKDKYIELVKKLDKKEQPKNINKINYGLSILKLIMEFLVVVVHNFNKLSTNNKIILYITRNRKLHVPSFFIMSFLFIHKSLLSLNTKIIFKRLMRLLLPYFIWPIIIWKINHYYNKKYNKNLSDSYEDLKKQLLFGHWFTPQFWFLWNLVAITIFFIIIIIIFRKHYIFTLLIIYFSLVIIVKEKLLDCCLKQNLLLLLDLF